MSWRYIFIILVLAILAGGVIFLLSMNQESISQLPEIEKPGVIIPEPEQLEEAVPNELTSLMLSELIERFGSEECKQKGEAGITSQDSDFDLEKVDLNTDGIEEFIFAAGWICGELIRGASGNGPFLIYQKINDSWVSIGGEIWGLSYLVKDGKTDGYQDIETTAHLSVSSGLSMVWKWQKSELKYQQIKSEEFIVESRR